MGKRKIRVMISLLICLSMLLSNIHYVYADEEEKIQYLQIQMMEYDSEVSEYAHDGEAEWVNAVNVDGCVFIDFQTMCDLLQIKENGGDYSVENSPTEQESGFISSNFLNEEGTFKEAYEETFGITLNEETMGDGFFVQKNRNSEMKFYMRNGSDIVYMYSNHMGSMTAHLGDKVCKVNGCLMVPMIMFLHLLDVDCKLDNHTVCLYPDRLTVMDILSDRSLSDYYFDIVSDTELDDQEFMTKSGGILLYCKLKDMIQGTVTLEFDKIMSYIDDASVIAANLADEISQNSVSESSRIADRIVANNLRTDIPDVMMSYLSDYLVGDADTPGVILEGTEEAYLQVLSDWDEAEKKLLEKVADSGDLLLETKIENVLKYFNAENADIAAE